MKTNVTRCDLCHAMVEVPGNISEKVVHATFLLNEKGRDITMTVLTCPYCGQPLTLGEWTRKDGNTMLAYARCNEGDEYLAVCRYGRTPEGIRMGRMVYEMSDDLWDVYQRCIERQA